MRPPGAPAISDAQIFAFATVTLLLPEPHVDASIYSLGTRRRSGFLRLFRCEIKTISAADAVLGTAAFAVGLLLAWLIAKVSGHSSGCYPRSEVRNGSDPLL